MPRSIDIVGRKFGYLTVTRQVDPLLYPWRGRRALLPVARFEVRCDCGAEKICKSGTAALKAAASVAEEK